MALYERFSNATTKLGDKVKAKLIEWITSLFKWFIDLSLNIFELIYKRWFDVTEPTKSSDITKRIQSSEIRKLYQYALQQSDFYTSDLPPIIRLGFFLIHLYTFINNTILGGSQPIQDLITQETYNITPVRIPDQNELATAFLRNTIKPSEYYQYMRFNGYSPYMSELIYSNKLSFLAPDNYVELVRRGQLTLSDLRFILSQQGLREIDAKFLGELTYSYLTKDEYVEAWRRGKIHDDDLIRYMQIIGVKLSEIDILKSLTRKYLSPAEYITAWLRNELDAKSLDNILYNSGIEQSDINLLKKLAFYIPPPADLVRMAVREVFTPEVAQKFGQYEDFPAQFAKYAKMQGISEEWAKAYWAAHWDLPSATMGFEMLHRGIISEDELKMLLRALDVMPYWRDKIIKLSYNPYTRVDVRRMYRTGVIDEKQVYKTYRDLGYDDEHARNLTTFTIIDALEEERELTKSEILKSFKLGSISESECLSMLRELNYAKTFEDKSLLYFCGKVYAKEGMKEGYNSFVAIASHVTSYARVKLLKYIEIAGWQNVYYCDTDSIFCNENGYRNLYKYIDKERLGYLSIKDVTDVLEIYNVKDYKFNNETKKKGLRKDAIQVEENVYKQWQWISIRGMLRKGLTGGYYRVMQTKTYSKEYKKGCVVEENNIYPLPLKLVNDSIYVNYDYIDSYYGECFNRSIIFKTYKSYEFLKENEEKLYKDILDLDRKKFKEIIKMYGGIWDTDYEYIPRWAKRKKTGRKLDELVICVREEGYYVEDANELYNMILNYS